MAAAVLAGCGGPKLATADEQMARGEYFDASKTYRKVYNKLTKREERPLRGEVAYKMAECHRKLSQNARASAAYQNALRYGHIIVIGFPFAITATVINSAIRTDGSPRYAMFSMMIGAILNTILDPVFIFVLHWGVEGAAAATILSQFVGFLCNVAYLFKFKTIHLEKSSFVFHARIVGRLASLGFASCFNNLTSTVVAMISNNLLTKYGALSAYGPDIPITTFGLCMKVSMIAFSVGIGVASGSQPIIGFNYGAQKYDRVRRTFLLSAAVCSVITLVAWGVFQCFPLQLIRIFGTESSLYEEFAVQCFRVYLMLTFLNGLQMCTGVFFQAIEQPAKAAVASLSKQLLFYIPAMLICSRIWGLTGILAAGPVADTLAFALFLPPAVCL